MPVILVGSHHEYFVAAGGSLLAQGADHVIGFIAIQLHDGQIKAANYFFYIRNGADQVFRSLLAVRLIFCKISMSFGGSMRVEAHGQMCGLLVIDQVEQGIGKSELGIGITAL